MYWVRTKKRKRWPSSGGGTCIDSLGPSVRLWMVGCMVVWGKGGGGNHGDNGFSN
jgi:hypothetical protein